MSKKLYLIFSGFVFLLVAIFHLFRLVYHWPVVVGPAFARDSPVPLPCSPRDLRPGTRARFPSEIQSRRERPRWGFRTLSHQVA